MFISSKRALPGLTVAMLAISAFLRDWGWFPPSTGVQSVVAVISAKRTHDGTPSKAACCVRPVLGGATF